jgi:hypothetical protein
LRLQQQRTWSAEPQPRSSRTTKSTLESTEPLIDSREENTRTQTLESEYQDIREYLLHRPNHSYVGSSEFSGEHHQAWTDLIEVLDSFHATTHEHEQTPSKKNDLDAIDSQDEEFAFTDEMLGVILNDYEQEQRILDTIEEMTESESASWSPSLQDPPNHARISKQGLVLQSQIDPLSNTLSGSITNATANWPHGTDCRMRSANKKIVLVGWNAAEVYDDSNLNDSPPVINSPFSMGLSDPELQSYWSSDSEGDDTDSSSKLKKRTSSMASRIAKINLLRWNAATTRANFRKLIPSNRTAILKALVKENRKSQTSHISEPLPAGTSAKALKLLGARHGMQGRHYQMTNR